MEGEVPHNLSLNVVRRTSEGTLEDFATTWAFQKNLVEEKARDRSVADTLVLVEHKHVYTAGRTIAFQPTDTMLAAQGLSPVPWVEVNRGGQATYHGPGQLVAYPIFDLNNHGRDVHKFLRLLEDTILACLYEFDIVGYRVDGKTGVWVTDENGDVKKIASIGIGVSRWISYHGLAINVSTDLRYFQAISACGETGEQVTSIDKVLRAREIKSPTLAEVQSALIRSFYKIFKYNPVDLRPMKLDQASAPLPFVKPKWLKVKAPGSPKYLETRKIVKSLRLNTVCEEAHCPNIGECWSHHTATFMIMGELCTRRCSFCAVKDGTLANLQPLDPLEPFRVGRAVSELGLEHVVITSVDRDDVADMGARHFDKTVRSIRQQNPNCNIELLIPDLRGKRELLGIILESGFVSILNHNVETVPSLYKRVRPGANFERSLNILRWAKEFQPDVRTKSGIMVGLGEEKEQVYHLMDRLREANVDILTVGQYLRPSQKQLEVTRFITPEEFESYREEGLRRGFSYVESGALVRSSYHAWKHSADLKLPEQAVG